ncbi:MAG: SurA N-terminal domain-containing protein [Thermodesulfovibrionales bacterium]|nr:SurA N-terminal domain-containing protein [Thermodesulfovibrionales bacterium]
MLLMRFLLVVFILFFVTQAYAGIMLDKVVAIVNKEVITWSELYKSMEFEATDVIKNLPPEEKKKLFKENEHNFLETMIDMKLQLQEAEKNGITVSKADIDNAIEMIRNKHGLSKEDFESAIKKEGFTLSEYRKKLTEQIILNRIVDQEIRNKIIVSDDDINKALADDKTIREIEGYSLSIIVLKKTQDKEGLERLAKEIYERIKNGESFETLARQHSQDTSAPLGGNLGFISKKDISAQLKRVIDTLKEKEVSEPYWTDMGITIIRLNERREYKDEKERREAVKQKLLEERFNTRYRSWLKGLRERAYVEIKI